MIPLRYNTASQEVPLGYFLDDTDGDTAETGLTIANTDIKLWKHGASTLANKNSGGATHMSGGVYYAVLDATDTGTVGGLSIFVHVAGALATRVDCVVYPQNVYDSLFAGTDYLLIDALQVEGTDATDAIESAVDTALTSYDASTATALASVASDVTDILADTGTSGVVVSSATMQAIADEVLKRGVGNVEDSADANSLAAVVLATFFGSIAGTTFTVKKTDGSTTFGTTTVTTDVDALPIIAVGV